MADSSNSADRFQGHGEGLENANGRMSGQPTPGPDLLPCPFCGGTKFQQNTKAKGYFIKKAAERAGKDTSNHIIRCTKCGAKGPLKHSEAEAVAAWNRRTDAAPDLLSALEVAAEELEYFVEFACRQCEFEGDADAGMAAVRNARAAIRKARGQEVGV